MRSDSLDKKIACRLCIEGVQTTLVKDNGERLQRQWVSEEIMAEKSDLRPFGICPFSCTTESLGRDVQCGNDIALLGHPSCVCAEAATHLKY